MRSRLALWSPVGALAVAAGVLGLVQGQRAASLTESDVIARMADRYASEASGRRATDCIAVPGAVPSVWIEVRCGADPVWVGRVDRNGKVLTAGVLGPEA